MSFAAPRLCWAYNGNTVVVDVRSLVKLFLNLRVLVLRPVDNRQQMEEHAKLEAVAMTYATPLG